MAEGTPVPWKKTQEGRIVYDRRPKPFHFSDALRVLRSISAQDSNTFREIPLNQFVEAQGLVSFLYARSAVTSFLGIDVPKLIADVLQAVITGFGEELFAFLRNPRVIEETRLEISLLREENERLRNALRLYERV